MPTTITEVIEIISSEDECIIVSPPPPPRSLVLPRPVFNSKSTRALRCAIRRQQREAEYRAEKAERRARKKAARKAKKTARRAERKAEKSARSLQRKLNCNGKRSARPGKGVMKDRENSDPSEGEEEGVYWVQLEERVYWENLGGGGSSH